jgi:hypothetical protein
MAQKVKREFYKGRIVAASVLAVILFSCVFMFGYLVSQDRYDQNFYEQQKILRSYLTLQVEKDILQSTCSPEAITLSAKNLDELGVFITLLEEKLGFDDDNLKEQKNDYYLLEAQHMTLVQEQNERCDTNNDIVLFFYSNEEDLVDRGEEIGFILLTAKKENQNIMIYSFDYDADYSLVSLLKEQYNVDSPNTVVLNGKVTQEIRHINDFNKALTDGSNEKDGTIHLN